MYSLTLNLNKEDVVNKFHLVFSHGKESGPWGSKIAAMAEHIKNQFECEIHSLDYQQINSPDERAEYLMRYLESLSGPIVLVGSSMGGYVSTLAATNKDVAGLLLLAPAFYLQGYSQQNPTIENPAFQNKNTIIIHGWHDDIVPFVNSVKFAKEHSAKLVLVDDGHRLSNSITILKDELVKIIEVL